MDDIKRGLLARSVGNLDYRVRGSEPNRQPVHFRELWNDSRVDMLRLPGIVACSSNLETLGTLCELAASWNANRYDE